MKLPLPERSRFAAKFLGTLVKMSRPSWNIPMDPEGSWLVTTDVKD
jgi:hypothetical protein